MAETESTLTLVENVNVVLPTALTSPPRITIKVKYMTEQLVFELSLIIDGTPERSIAEYNATKVNGKEATINRVVDGSTYPG